RSTGVTKSRRPWTQANVARTPAQAPTNGASALRDALPRAWPVGEPAVAGAIGQARGRRVAAEAEVVGAGGIDRPAASRLGQFEQRTAMRAGNGIVDGRGLRSIVERLQQPVLLPWPGLAARPLSGIFFSRRRPRLAVCFAGQVETGKLADDGVAADADIDSDFAAGPPGLKADFQAFEAFGGPGGCIGGHVDGSAL